MIVKNPAKSPKAFQDPKILSVFPTKTWNDNKSGIKKRKLWNINKIVEDKITPKKTVPAFLLSFKTRAETNIKRNAPNIK